MNSILKELKGFNEETFHDYFGAPGRNTETQHPRFQTEGMERYHGIIDTANGYRFSCIWGYGSYSFTGDYCSDGDDQLHEELKKIARRQGVSPNAEIGLFYEDKWVDDDQQVFGSVTPGELLNAIEIAEEDLDKFQAKHDFPFREEGSVCPGCGIKFKNAKGLLKERNEEIIKILRGENERRN